MDEKSRRPDRVLRALLPWLVAAAGLGVYLVTLHPWISLDSLPVVSGVAGWDWTPPLTQPVFYTLTVPFRWLPARWLPMALNTFSAVCASLTLAMLVRSVTLLPRDRVPIFRQSYITVSTFMPMAWAPPLLAAAACGLQLTFWEHATAATGEMLTLLMFAYIIRCVLEFRHRQRDLWLYQAALVAGLAITNDWAMLGFFPIFLLALIWVKGVAFFNQKFLLRIVMLGLAGLSLYVLPPLVMAWTADSSIPAWKAIKHNPGSQLGILAFLVGNFYSANRDTAVLLALVSLFPLLFMSIRWQSFSGGTMMAGAWLVTLPFHIAHAVFLGVCLWVFLDPPFSPRVAGRALGGSLPFLTLYFLAALELGYYCGYFLQRFGLNEPQDPNNPMPVRRNWGPLVQGLAVAVLLAFPGLLLLKNWPYIRMVHNPDLQRYAAASVAALPPAGGALLSDDPLRLGLTQAALAGQGKLHLYAPVDTRMITDPKYLDYLSRHYPKIWTAAPPSGLRKLDPIAVLRMLREVEQASTLCYLHPSFGYFFENFYAEPQGLVSLLRLYPTNSLTLPPFTARTLQASASAWQQLDTDILASLTARLAATETPVHNLRWKILRKIKAHPEQDFSLWLVSAWYSRALNDWGVALQRNHQLPEAARAFERARDLKPDNLPALVNLFCCTNLVAGNPLELDVSRSPETALGRYRDWESVMNENGPFDAPEFSLAIGQLFAGNSLYRQAAQQFERINELVPDFVYAKIILANIDATLGRHDQALERVAAIRNGPLFKNITPAGRTELDLIETAAWLGRTNDARADQVISTILSANPTNLTVMDRVFALYAGKQRYTNALDLVARQLQLAPDNPSYLVNQAYVWLQLGSYTNAIPPLTQALTISTNNVQARLNRAIAYLHAGQLENSHADYAALEEIAPDSPQIQYGLAEVAWRQHQTNETILHLSNYLSNAIPGSAEAKLVEARLQELKGSRK